MKYQVNLEITYRASYIVDEESVSEASDMARDKALDGVGMDSWDVPDVDVIEAFPVPTPSPQEPGR